MKLSAELLAIQLRTLGVVAYSMGYVVLSQWLPLVSAMDGNVQAAWLRVDRGMVAPLYTCMVVAAVAIICIVMSFLPRPQILKQDDRPRSKGFEALAYVSAFFVAIAAITLPLWFAGVLVNPSEVNFSVKEIEAWERMKYPIATAFNSAAIVCLVAGIATALAASWIARPRSK